MTRPHHRLKPRCPNCGNRLPHAYSESGARMKVRQHLTTEHGLTEIQAEEFAEKWTPRRGPWRQSLSDQDLADAVKQREFDELLDASVAEDPREMDFDLDAYNASRF